MFSFKEGMLAAIAHDLKLLVGRFRIEVEGDRIEAHFDARSLRVVCAMKYDIEAPDALGEPERGEIERNLQRDVLKTDRYPEMVLRGVVSATGNGHQVSGTLSLHGREKPIVVQSRVEAKVEIAEVTLHQPDFGIRPFTAMLGTLKIRPDVLVRITVPAAKRT